MDRLTRAATAEAAPEPRSAGMPRGLAVPLCLPVRARDGDHTNHTRVAIEAGDQSSLSGHIAAGQGPVANGVLLPVVSR